ncbi:MAG: 50S ribosomal protein L4 [Candidatus Woesearchaeota archaeon]|jgi:large subunit ribosomal protein L4e
MAKKANVYKDDGEKVSSITLPDVFDEFVRKDLISRAVLAVSANSRQKYGAAPLAGKRHSVDVKKRRRDYKTCYGHGMSRVPRKVLSRSGTRFSWVSAFAPGTWGGRNAHPPKSQKNWEQKINIKERRLAIRSAIAATSDKEIVSARGHKFQEVTCILDDACENIEKTKDVLLLLEKLGFTEELERIEGRQIRAGKGKLRGRKYKSKTGPLIVVSKNCPLAKSAANIVGVDVVTVNFLNAAKLAPGCMPGRLTLWTKGAIEKLKDGLFA